MWSRDDLYRIHAYGALDWTVTDTINDAGAQDQRLTLASPMGMAWWNKSKGIAGTFDGKQITYPMVRKLKATLVDVLSGMSHMGGATPNPFTGYSNCCCFWNDYYQCASFFVLTSAGYTAGYLTDLRIDYFPQEDAIYLQTVSNVTAAHCYSDALDGDVHPMVGKYGLTAKLYGESELSQSQKFDPHGRFIRRYLPQLAPLPDKLIHAPWLARPTVDLAAVGVELGKTYPLPIVRHEEARARTLERFGAARRPAPR